jgi:Tol biopolymer transport system component
MAFTPGTTVGSYRLLDRLGVGGMGEVFRAHDTRLGRDVALKVLPDAFASDSDWFIRFEHEARVLASLNHPNIAMLFGFKEIDDRSVIEMELVPGETLARRLATGSMPIEEALPVVKQIAQALEAAHERGVIHRDLKPANIKITPDGRVKVLDFGLAKVLESHGASDEITHSEAPPSHPGTILGTPRYMSPEQVRGKPLDRRTDIWSFGCVFYEALTGRPPFTAEPGSDVLAAVLRDEPDWQALDHVPAPIQRLIRRCMRKDLQLRLRDIADARIEIEELLNETASVALASRADLRRRLLSRRSLAVAALAAALAAAGVTAWWMAARSPAPRPRLTRVAIPLDPGQHLVSGTSMPLALSPDGTRLAYVAARAGARSQIFLRGLDRFEATPIAGTEGATAPFFSPDGEWLGFYAGDSLKRVSLRGGIPLEICEAPSVASAAWAPDDSIVFATTLPGDGLWRVAASGGDPAQLTKPDPAKGVLRHTHPRLLPDGTTVLFTAVAADSAYAGLLSLTTRDSRVLPQTRMVGGGAQFVGPDHLVYAQAGSLIATTFDPRRGEVRGAPLPLLERVDTAEDGTAWFDVLPGALVYVPGRTTVPQRTLMLIDREGRATRLTELRGAYSHPRFSPDGRWVAVEIDSASGSDIWLYDVRRGTRTRFTSTGASKDPTWTRDARWVAFQTSRTAAWTLFKQATDGSGLPQPLLTAAPPPRQAVMSQIAARLLPGTPPALTGANPQYPASWAAGGALAFTERRPSGERDIWVLEPGSDPTPFLMTPWDEWAPAFSPDGRLLAYVSDESGRSEVYVQPYPGPGQKWLISTEGGSDPVWAPDGRELFYRLGSHMMSVPVQFTPAFAAGTPRLLFDGAFETSELGRNFDVSADGQRFLVIRSENAEPPPEFHFVFNWARELDESGQRR